MPVMAPVERAGDGPGADRAALPEARMAIFYRHQRMSRRDGRRRCGVPGGVPIPDRPRREFYNRKGDQGRSLAYLRLWPIPPIGLSPWGRIVNGARREGWGDVALAHVGGSRAGARIAPLARWKMAEQIGWPIARAPPAPPKASPQLVNQWRGMASVRRAGGRACAADHGSGRQAERPGGGTSQGWRRGAGRNPPTSPN